jgi:hypothetical protein
VLTATLAVKPFFIWWMLSATVSWRKSNWIKNYLSLAVDCLTYFYWRKFLRGQRLGLTYALYTPSLLTYQCRVGWVLKIPSPRTEIPTLWAHHVSYQTQHSLHALFHVQLESNYTSTNTSYRYKWAISEQKKDTLPVLSGDKASSSLGASVTQKIQGQ